MFTQVASACGECLNSAMLFETNHLPSFPMCLCRVTLKRQPLPFVSSEAGSKKSEPNILFYLFILESEESLLKKG